MGLSCWSSKLYDWSKRTWLIQQLFYHGQKVERFGTITIEGTVVGCPHKATDGDCTFDVQTDSLVFGNPILNWHCEVTPCQNAKVHADVAALKSGDRVRVTGSRFRDPTHLGHPDHLEIHPVEEVQLV